MPDLFTPILMVFPDDNEVTRRVAGEIAATFREAALTTELREMGARPSLDHYGTVVIGAPLESEAWQASAGQFLVQNRARLLSLPVAVFALAEDGTAPEDGGGRQELLEALARHGWLHPIAADVFSVTTGGDAGRARELPLASSIDLDAVRSWAGQVARMLTPAATR